MIYIVEDDSSIRELEQYALQSNGYETTGCEDAASFWAALRSGRPDLVILDVMLPDEDGYQILAKLRADPTCAATPVIMVTARDDEKDKILGLENGADDYINKPFSMNEVIARIRANIRRHKDEVVGNAADGDGGVITVRGLSIDKNRYAVRMGDAELELSKKEYELLLFLMQHPGVPFSREDLLDKVWGYGDFIGDVNTVDVTVSRLRKKLEKDPSNPSYLITKRGVGYYIQ